ncbi:MAG TPA: response regulator [Caulobacteraceae bacterium]|jgi:CheY-like chemotaxis protein
MVQNVSTADSGFLGQDGRALPASEEALRNVLTVTAAASAGVDAWRAITAFTPQIDLGLRQAWKVFDSEGPAGRRSTPAASPAAIDRAIQGAFIARDLLEAAEDAIGETVAAGERRSWDERAFDVAALVGEVIGLVRSRANAAGVELKLDAAGLDTPQVVGDPNRLHRMLIKLLNGAVKSQRTGEVTVSLHSVERDHELALDIAVAAGPRELRLSGRGPEPSRETWRERWIDSELSIGITDDLSWALEGALDGADESGFDLAVAIRLRMPIARVEPAFTQPKAAGPIASDALNGLRVLVAEDSDLNRELIQMLLAPFGCIVDEAVNGQAALDAIEARAYDAILMDMNMPVMDGFEATRRIRARADDRAHTPVLAVTGRALSADIAKMRTMGASGHLSKPYSTEELVGAIISCTRA